MENSTRKYQKFGQRTLVMLILGKSLPAALTFLILIIFSAAPGFFPDGYSAISSLILLVIASILALTLLLALAGGWLEYRNYAIFFDENNFKIRRGALSVEEIGVPYRHVREVRIKRSVADQLAGVSKVIISKIQDEDSRLTAEEQEIVLSSIDQATAVQIQDAILKKTEIEKMAIVSQ